jgi:hypothetical protein
VEFTIVEPGVFIPHAHLRADELGVPLWRRGHRCCRVTPRCGVDKRQYTHPLRRSYPQRLAAAALRGVLAGRPGRRGDGVKVNDYVSEIWNSVGALPGGRSCDCAALLGYAAALGRAKLAAMTRENLVVTADGGLRALIPLANPGRGAWLGSLGAWHCSRGPG